MLVSVQIVFQSAMKTYSSLLSRKCLIDESITANKYTFRLHIRF
jgi:hypothetical protein